MNIIQFMDAVLGKWFAGKSWSSWRVLLCAAFGLPMTEGQLEIFRACTGRAIPPTTPCNEISLIVGRRGGKSLVTAAIAVFCATVRTYSNLAAGETAVVMLLGADRAQAKVSLRYIEAFLTVPMLAAMVESRTAESITLKNGIEIVIGTSDYRSVRGRTIVCCIADEISFWKTSLDSVSPDREVLQAVRPAMATVPNALLIKSSSAYAQRGELWEDFRDYFGKEGATVFVWRARTRVMNPSVSRAYIALQYLKDAQSARAEYGSQFRSDISSLFDELAIRACVESGCYERPPKPGIKYVSFCDPSGGRSDSFTLAIGHSEKEIVVLDLVKEFRPPFDPQEKVEEIAATIKLYGGANTIHGDNYAPAWVQTAFEKVGVKYLVSEKTRTELYLELLPMVNSGECELLDNARLIAQLCGLERRTGRSGRDSVDHRAGEFDDLANAVAGCIVNARVAKAGVLGVIEFAKKFGKYLFALPPNTNPVPSSTSTTTMAHAPLTYHEPSPGACEMCHATCIQKCSGRWRCSQCGHVWGAFYTAPPVTRADVLSGRHRARQFKYLERKGGT